MRGFQTQAQIAKLSNWIELSWIELNWIELNWIELNWVELSWIKLNWIEVNPVPAEWSKWKWIELNWLNLNWIDVGCMELLWMELDWMEFSWMDSWFALDRSSIDVRLVFDWYSVLSEVPCIELSRRESRNEINSVACGMCGLLFTLL